MNKNNLQMLLLLLIVVLLSGCEKFEEAQSAKAEDVCTSAVGSKYAYIPKFIVGSPEMIGYFDLNYKIKYSAKYTLGDGEHIMKAICYTKYGSVDKIAVLTDE